MPHSREWPGGAPVAGFSHVFDDKPGTIPAAEATGKGSSLVVKGAGGGTFLHVRTKDAKGAWSRTAHLPVVSRAVAATAAPPTARPAAPTGPPPAPYVSYVPSDRLDRTDFEWGRSPWWPESQMGEFEIRRESWLVRGADAATGGGAITIVNLASYGFYSAYMRRSSYDPVRWPRLAYDYKFSQPGCAVNLSIIVNGTSGIVEWTGRQSPRNYFTPYVIGKALQAIQDRKWHHVDVDLREILLASLFKDPAKRTRISVSEVATWGTNHNMSSRGESYSNPRGAKLKIDNFTIYSPTGSDPAFEWALHGWKGEVKGYSTAFDRKPDTVPPARVNTAAARREFKAIEPGKWWFHVRARSADGKWGKTTHREIEIEKRP